MLMNHTVLTGHKVRRSTPAARSRQFLQWSPSHMKPASASRKCSCRLRTRSLVQAIAIGLVILLASTSHAGLVVTIQDSGSNVTATLSGSFTSLPTPFTSGNTSFAPTISPSSPLLGVSDTAASPTNFPVHIYNFEVAQRLPVLGPGGSTAVDATTASTKFRVARTSVTLLQSYTLGTPFSGTMTWNNASIASLGLTAGTYSAVLEDVGETVTVNVVPEPSSIAMLGFAGIAAAAAFQRRRVARLGKRQ